MTDSKQLSSSGRAVQKHIPNAITVMVLGIISVHLSALSIPGLVLGIIALKMHRKVRAVHDSEPLTYTRSYRFARAGYICGIVGTSLSIFFLLFWIVYIIIIVQYFGVITSEIEMEKAAAWEQLENM